MKSRIFITFVLAAILLSACAQSTPGANPPPGIKPTSPGGTVTSPSPTSAPTTPAPAELTPAQIAAVDAASKKYNIPVDQIMIVSTESVTWTNGCLDVVIPGVMCTDVMVDGYRIIMMANGQRFEFHTDKDGTNVIDAAQQLSSLQFVVVGGDSTIQVVNPLIPLGETYNPAFNEFLPAGGTISGTAYVLDTVHNKAIAINANGTQDLAFIKDPNYGLAVWRGGLDTSAMLAWGTQPTGTERTSSLLISAPDGTNLQTLLTINPGSGTPLQLVAEFWSADGTSLYFSKEPVGLGGYIPFAGASNLYKIDIASKDVSTVIPQAAAPAPQTCLDSLSGDYRYVAENCTPDVITVRDLQNNSTTAIQAPPDLTGFRLMGSATFSPDGSQVAFAMAAGNPDREQGWVAIGNSSGGTASLVFTGDAGSYYTVLGWLDSQTLLVQSNPVMCSGTNCASQLFTVGVDGSNLTKVADGRFLAVIDNR